MNHLSYYYFIITVTTKIYLVFSTPDMELDIFNTISDSDENLGAAEIRGPDTPLSRQKRYLAFPNNSTLVLDFVLTVPVSGIPGLSNFNYYSNNAFYLHEIFPVPKLRPSTPAPTTTTTTSPMGYGYRAPHPPSKAYSSSHSSSRVDTIDGIHRVTLYEYLEDFLESRGYNGPQCLLRTICEIADAPFEQDVYGELANLLMSASMHPLEDGTYDKYMAAEFYGKHFGDCHKIYPKCPESVLGLVSIVR